MNREQAISFDNEIKRFANELSKKYDSPIGGDYISEEVISIIPETDKQGLITIHDGKSYSIKPSNVKVDLKKALAAGLELIVSLSMPRNMFNYIQLLLASVIFATKSMTIEIGKEEAMIVYWLHKNNYYDKGIEEDIFINNIKDFLAEKEIIISEKDIRDKINVLYKNDIIRIEEGIIFINEKVVGNR